MGGEGFAPTPFPFWRGIALGLILGELAGSLGGTNGPFALDWKILSGRTDDRGRKSWVLFLIDVMSFFPIALAPIHYASGLLYYFNIVGHYHSSSREQLIVLAKASRNCLFSHLSLIFYPLRYS
jgi:hypothetical protein